VSLFLGNPPVQTVNTVAREDVSANIISTRFMTENIMPLSQAVEAYELFNAHKVQKVVFVADK